MPRREFDRTLFERFEHVASPSQLVDYLDCPRKWWFRRCHQLKQPDDQKKFLFGNCLHAVVERWLEADDSGRIDGRPVDLYPEGWNEGLNAAETALVRVLFEKGVSSGMLRRIPGRVIERSYEREVVPGVVSIGALDCDSSEGVDDHKSTKNARYIATQDELASDPKMLSYAYEWLLSRWDALEADDPAVAAGLSLEDVHDEVPLRLNYFVKDPDKPAVKSVTVAVSTQDVLDFWEKTVVPAHQGMLDLKRAKIPELNWRRVTGPQSKNVCKKYGGCPYARICGGCQTPAAFRAEMARINLKSTSPKPRSRKPAMGIFKKNKGAAAPAAPAPVTITEPAAPASTTETAAEVTSNAPWAVESCAACKGKGINKSGNPCMACYHIRKRRGESTVDDFETWHDDAGNLCWKAKDGSAAPTPAPAAAPATEAQAAAGEVTGKAAIVEPAEAKPAKPRRTVKPKERKAPAPETKEPPAEARSAPTPPTPAQAPERSTVAAPAGGFRFYINAMPIGAPYVDVAEILAREGAELAEAQGVESYYALDPFKRRDVLAEHARDIAAELDGQDVVAIGGSQDLKALVEALRPFAAEIVQGVF